MTPESQLQYSQSADGTRIAFALHGKADAPHRVVLIHSLALDHRFWDRVVAHLGSDVAAAAIDARGHGRSDKPAGPYRIEQFAGDVAGVLDTLGWDKAVVGGASMGGSVALAFGIHHPGRTKGLGLFDTTAWYGATAPADWEGRGRKAAEEGLASLIAFQETRWFTDDFRREHPDVLARCKDIFVANDVPAYVETCRMMGSMDQRAGLAGIAVPTRILVGEEDFATPVAMSQALADAIPGASMRVLARARHLSPLEYPRDVADCLTELAKA